MSRDAEYTDATRAAANKCLEIALSDRQEFAKTGFPLAFVLNFIPNAANTFLATAVELMYQEMSGNDISVDKTWDKILEHKAKIGPLVQAILTERAAEDEASIVVRKTVETGTEEVTMAKFEVEMAAFAAGAIRVVDVPEREIEGKAESEILERVFHWGQNDFQPKKLPSVSVGDVVRIKGKRFIISTVGFKELKEDEKGGIKAGYGFIEG